MDNNKPDARPTQTERDLVPGSIANPPHYPLYGLYSPKVIAVGRAVQNRSDDAAQLRRWIGRPELGEGPLRELFELACWFHAHPEQCERDFVGWLARSRNRGSLYRLASRLSRMSPTLLDAAGSAKDLATVVRFGAKAFQPPHGSPRRRSAAAA